MFFARNVSMKNLMLIVVFNRILISFLKNSSGYLFFSDQNSTHNMGRILLKFLWQLSSHMYQFNTITVIEAYLKQSSFDLLFNHNRELCLVIGLCGLNVSQMAHSCHPKTSCLLKFQFRIPVREFK